MIVLIVRVACVKMFVRSSRKRILGKNFLGKKVIK